MDQPQEPDVADGPATWRDAASGAGTAVALLVGMVTMVVGFLWIGNVLEGSRWGLVLGGVAVIGVSVSRIRYGLSDGDPNLQAVRIIELAMGVLGLFAGPLMIAAGFGLFGG